MSENSYIEQFKHLQTAKKLESMGNSSRALEIYLEVHENCTPNTFDAYERPGLILEKQKKYKDAINLYKKALDAIDKDILSCSKDRFIKKIESAENKLKSTPKIKNEKSEENISNYKFGIVGFRRKLMINMVISSLYYLISIILSIYFKNIFYFIGMISILYLFAYFLDIIKIKTKKNKLIISILLIITLILSIYSAINIRNDFILSNIDDKDGKTEISNNLDKSKLKDIKKPVISKSNISDAIKSINDTINLKDIDITSSDSQIFIYAVVTVTTEEVEAKKLLDEIYNNLLEISLPYNDDIISDIEEFNEYYTFSFLAMSENEVDIIAKGKTLINKNKIVWE